MINQIKERSAEVESKQKVCIIESQGSTCLCALDGGQALVLGSVCPKNEGTGGVCLKNEEPASA